MNKKIIIVLLLTLLLGLVIFLKTKPAPVDQRKIRDLLVEGKPQKCIYIGKEKITVLEATFYTANNKIRGDLVSTGPQDSKIESHFIANASQSHVWNNFEEKGFIFDLTNQEEIAPSGANSSEDLNRMANYKCNGWVEDPSFFIPPSDIEFRDINSITPTPENP